MRVRLETRWTKEKGRKKLCALAPVDTIGSLGQMAYLKWVARISETHKTITDFDRYQSSMLHDQFLPSFLSICLSLSSGILIRRDPVQKPKSKRDWPNKSNTQSHSPSPFREKSGTMTLYSRQFSWRFIINKTRGERKERKKVKKNKAILFVDFREVRPGYDLQWAKRVTPRPCRVVVTFSVKNKKIQSRDKRE